MKKKSHSLAERCDCQANRESAAERIAEIVRTSVDPHASGHSDIVIVLINHTGSSLVGNVSGVPAKLNVLREALHEWGNNEKTNH